MRFAAAAAVFAVAVSAGEYPESSAPESTVYSTDYITVTSCAETVTNCPAHSTKVHTTVYPITTSTIYTTTTRTVTSCGPTVTSCPAHSTTVITETIPYSTTVCPVTQTYPTSKPYSNNTMTYPVGGNSPSSSPYMATTTPSYPTTVTKSSYPTTSVAPACPTYSVKTISTSVTTVVPTVIYETVAIPCPTTSYPASSPSGAPTGTGSSYPTKPSGVVTAGAANVAFSGLFAAAAGLAAVALA